MNFRNLRRPLALSALVLVLLVGLAYVFLRTGPLAPVKVVLVDVRQTVVNPVLFGIGTVEARRSWTLAPTAPGRVLAVHVDVGDGVAVDQPLAEMEPVDFKERLAALEASAARARHLRHSAEAQLADMHARRAVAEATLKRNESLAQQRFISVAALDSRQQEMRSAEAGVQVAAANLEASLQEELRLQAEREVLKRQRAHLTLSAPASATVASRTAEPGAALGAGQAVLKLIDPASLWVRLRLDQGRSQGLVEGLPARIQLRSRPGEVFAGQVSRLEPLADSLTEERLVQVGFSAVPAGLSVGEMAEVTLQLPEKSAQLVVPNGSVQRWGGQTGVWRWQDGQPVFVPVRTGASDPDGQTQVQAESVDALKVGDRVIAYSDKPIQPGVRVSETDSLLPPAPSRGGAR